jgi:hypothetical protein
MLDHDVLFTKATHVDDPVARIDLRGEGLGGARGGGDDNGSEMTGGGKETVTERGGLDGKDAGSSRLPSISEISFLHRSLNGLEVLQRTQETSCGAMASLPRSLSNSSLSELAVHDDAMAASALMDLSASVPVPETFLYDMTGPPDSDYFQEMEGTKKQKNGQREATFLCKCCPLSRFGDVSTDGVWPLDLGRPVGWKNPITIRLSTKEFEKGCRDHVRSKNGRHRFWETVERVDKMMTSGSACPSQQDLRNLAAGGEILEELFDKYVEYWKDYEKMKDGVPNLVPRPDYEKEKDGVMAKFGQARRVLQKLNIDIRPLSQKRKAHVIVKRLAAFASVPALGSSATPSLSAFGPTPSPPLTVSTPASAALATHLENHIKTETEVKTETLVKTSAAAMSYGAMPGLFGSAQNQWHGGGGHEVQDLHACLPRESRY